MKQTFTHCKLPKCLSVDVVISVYQRKILKTKAKAHTHTHTHTHTYIYIYMCVCVYIYINIYVVKCESENSTHCLLARLIWSQFEIQMSKQTGIKKNLSSNILNVTWRKDRHHQKTHIDLRNVIKGNTQYSISSLSQTSIHLSFLNRKKIETFGDPGGKYSNNTNVRNRSTKLRSYKPVLFWDCWPNQSSMDCKS